MKKNGKTTQHSKEAAVKALLAQVTEEAEQAAADRLEPKLRALHPASIMLVTVDLFKAGGTALKTVERVVERVPEIFELNGVGIEAVANLRDAALAACFHHRTRPSIIELTKGPQAAANAALVQEGKALRSAFAEQARVLARPRWGLLDRQAVQALGLGTGKETLVRDLDNLVRIFKPAWKAVEGRTPVTQEDLDRMTVLVRDLPRVLARETGDDQARRAEALGADLRARSFTLLVTANQLVHDAVALVRSSEGDADAIVPSLYAEARARRRAPAKGKGASSAAPSIVVGSKDASGKGAGVKRASGAAKVADAKDGAAKVADAMFADAKGASVSSRGASLADAEPVTVGA